MICRILVSIGGTKLPTETCGDLPRSATLAESLGKPLPWAVGFFFGTLELSLELFNVIAGISGMDE